MLHKARKVLRVRASSHGPAARNSKMIEQRARDFEARLDMLGFKQENLPAEALRQQALAMFDQLGRKKSA